MTTRDTLARIDNSLAICEVKLHLIEHDRGGALALAAAQAIASIEAARTVLAEAREELPFARRARA